MKQKTHKSISKRIKVTKSGKIMKRRGGQDHFNTRDTGKKVRNKRRDDQMSKANRNLIKDMLPHHRVK